jgi:nucleotide-binding universal stress UspA family protein
MPMTIAALMVYVDPEQQTEQQVRVARELATKFGASVIGVSALMLPPPLIADGVVVQAATEEEVKATRDTLATKEDWFRSVVGLPKEKVEWRWAIESPIKFLANQARAADLVVMKSGYESAEPTHFVDSAEAVLRMGRPVIFVPDNVTELKADRIVVGWKDTREARIAVLHALPLLASASEVSIVEICLSSEQDAARRRVNDVAKYLSASGAKCRTDVRVHTAEADAAHLLRLAMGVNADLIVSGAYGHSRLGEWLFGGMTRGLLRDARCCLMMSH